MDFTERLELLIKNSQITKKELAEKAGITTQSFFDWKKRNAVPGADIACKLAACLNATVEYLVTGKEPPVVEKIPADLQEIINKYAEKPKESNKKQKKDLTNGVSDNYTLSQGDFQ